MRILMVYCNTSQDNTVPIGITQVITCLQKAGHEVDLFHTTFYRHGGKSSAELRMEALQYKPCEYSYEKTDMCSDFVKRIRDFNPDMIGFSVFEVTFNIFKKLLASAKEIIRSKGIKVAAGGVHAIFWPESIAAVEDVDFIAISEAETTFVDLCKKMASGADYRDQPGFWVKEDDKWRKNAVKDITNLDTLPLSEPALFGERFMMKPMMGKLRRTITVELSRGCPYRCTYCADAFLTEKFRHLGRWYRVKTVAKLDEEFAALVKKYNPEFIYKFSETFLVAGKKWLFEYNSMYKKYRLPFWTQSRPETITKENIRIIKEMNCIRFSMGLESGNEEYRKKHLQRGYTNKQVIKAAGILKKFGISFSMNLIIGFPFETRKMVFDGIEILRKAKPDSISVYLFTPYKGCFLRKVCEENNMIDADFIGEDYFQMKYSLRNNTFGQEVIGLWRTVPLYVYLSKTRYGMIRKAENMDAGGNRAFGILKKEFYEKMGWNA